MALPGDHAVKQFARGEEVDFESYVPAEGEVCIMLADDPADMEIRVGDGETVGGARFVTKEYVDLVGNSGVAEGDTTLAAAGVDTEQRSWPATAFGLFAKIDGQAFTGTPTVPAPADSDDSFRIAPTSWVRNLVDSLVSQTTSDAETIFPVGSYLLVNNNGFGPIRNGLPGAVLRLSTANTADYIFGGAGAAIAGTWRGRGRAVAVDNNTLMQRIA